MTSSAYDILRHRSMFAVDIAQFSTRAPYLQAHLRAVMYEIVQDACDNTGPAWSTCEHEDRGDGILVITPPDTDVELLLAPLATRIRTALNRHNRRAGTAAQIKLRMSVHAGYVQADDHGVTGPDVILLFRLLDAPATKTRLTNHSGHLMLIVSDYLFQVATGYGLIEPSDYLPITVKLKETTARAWTCVQ